MSCYWPPLASAVSHRGRADPSSPYVAAARELPLSPQTGPVAASRSSHRLSPSRAGLHRSLAPGHCRAGGAVWKPAMLGASSAGTVPGSAAASLSGRKRLTQAHRRVSGLLLRASRNVQVHASGAGTLALPPPVERDPLGVFSAPSAGVAFERLSLALRGLTAPVGTIAGDRNRGGMSAGGGDAPETVGGKLAKLLLLVLISRIGVYIPISGVDREAFAAALQGGTDGAAGVLSYVDALTGGSISRVGVFTLGIVPYINASIVFQLLSTAFPELKEMQREGPVGRKKFQDYQKYAAVVFALAQAIGQLNYLRPFVDDFTLEWLAGNALLLTGGAMALVWIADEITKLKLGNGTSILIFVSIVSALPTSLGATLQQAAEQGWGSVGVFLGAFLATCLGIVYVQEAERRIPINYASQYQGRAGFSIGKNAFLPFKVNATGVMPVIFSTSLLALPASLARFSNNPTIESAAAAFTPSGSLYLPFNIALIVMFNYYYTFLQFEPSDVADQLKRQGASLAGIRPGKNTADFITDTLARMSVLGSAFLGALAAAPALVEAVTHLQAFRGFAGTSVLILVGVATDMARRLRAETIMDQYKEVDDFYKQGR